jgi:hypothetical protein
MNVASRNTLSVANRQRNYLDRMSIAPRQQQRDRNCKQHAEARARLIDQEQQQERHCNHEQQAEACARLTYQQRQQQRDHDRERHRQARGQQYLHIAACIPLSEFDEASVPVLDIGGRTTECQ